MSREEMLDRVRLMADGGDKGGGWHLIREDRAALTYVLESRDELLKACKLLTESLDKVAPATFYKAIAAARAAIANAEPKGSA